ncbi:hypothetical protein CTA2_12361 [Colletotrichum tanaceti]|uniref:Uncharacterized protein n=1 Tax=Colletotrichum tanaceti TaxID=1306861 RepID=A0A4U6XV08_9PEZI|nr:hypothetical protein CTA2_12361 [Colletotrichum tanaceti]TKW59768.1 hypothetical protein CTA1_10481 [Colletotrichum tanaceti]
MRHSLFFAVAALSYVAQSAVVDRRQVINIDGNGKVNVEGNGGAAVEVKTVDLQNSGAVLGKGGNGGGLGQGNIIAGILDSLNGNRGNQNGAAANCPPPPPPVTVTKTIYQNASVPAPLTIFVTQAALPPQVVTQLVTTTVPPAVPPPAVPPPAPPAAPAAAPASSQQPGLVIPGPPQPPPFAGLSSPSSRPPVASARPIAAEPPVALPQVGNPPAGGSPTTSMSLGGLRGSAAKKPAAGATPPVAANPIQPEPAVSGLELSKSLQLGNLLQQTIQLQARETPPSS